MMTEKEKMLAGELYDCADADLQARWHRAKDLQREYDACDTRDVERMGAIMDQMLGGKGKNVWIAPPFMVDYGENIYIGDNVEVNMNCVFLDCNRITIGKNSGIAPGVHIYTVFHPLKASERLPEKSRFWNSLTAPVTIGENVWIGGGAIILPGVTIGDNTTIGAGSVVSRSIPANSLAVGNPARVVKKL